MVRTAVETIDWEGLSGQRYTYGIYPISETFKAAAGNYIFAKETAPGRFRPIYIGQTENLNERLENHHKESCARRHGATHIHAHLNSVKADRLREERDLIAMWNPVCNG